MFKLLKQSKISKARLGRLQTKNGIINTPFFMPDATRAVLKNISASDTAKIGLDAMVVNTYHLYLQPGMEIIKKDKGVNNFMQTKLPLLSDSGGYQVFSLIHRNKAMGKILEDKVIFKSPIDGSMHELTPEKSIQIQFDLGVSMMVCLDDCPPNDYNDNLILQSIDRTINWAKRCKKEYDRQIKKRKIISKNRPLLFGVIQGGTKNELRKKCAEALVDIGFDGYGFGARPIDKEGNFLGDVLGFTANLIPQENLRFGLGIGTPEDIVRCVALGWDMFDCVIPTREGRHGKLFLWKSKSKVESRLSPDGGKSKVLDKYFYETINISNSKFAKDFSVINPLSKIEDLKKYSRAYLYHLFKINDPLGQRLASLNNLEFYLDLMREIRNGIKQGKI